MDTIQRIQNVAASDVHEVGELLACGDCAPADAPVVLYRYALTTLDAWCDYCGRDLTHPTMFDSTPHAL